MNSSYDYHQLTNIQTSSYKIMHHFESTRHTKSPQFDDSNTTADFNSSNHHFECLINEAEGVNVDTIANESKSEDEIVSLASRYTNFFSNEGSSKQSHHVHHVHQDTNQTSYLMNYGINNTNHYSCSIDKNLKISNDFMNSINKFQYVLMAPTSPAVKVNEDTLTYLNQGQNYEIRLNRFINTTNQTVNHSDQNHGNTLLTSSQSGYIYDTRHLEDVKPLVINGKISPRTENVSVDNSNHSNFSENNASDKIKLYNSNNGDSSKTNLYLSVIRLCFWDRKLQEIELDEIKEWEKEYNNIRMLEIDSNSSYGIIEVRLSDLYTNAAEIVWSGRTGANVFFRCNCTSTAFAPHKHGGEKGIHMRFQIDTYEIFTNSGQFTTSSFQNLNPNLTVNCNDYHTSSILSPPNSSSSPISSKFIKDDTDFNSEFQQKGYTSSFFSSGNFNNNWRHSCSSYCRIQLFRLKGAQRKLKTDRSKIERLNPPDLRKRYQPSNKITLLYNCPFDQLYSLLPFNREQEMINHSTSNDLSSNHHGVGSDFGLRDSSAINQVFSNSSTPNLATSNIVQQSGVHSGTSTSSSHLYGSSVNYNLQPANLSSQSDHLIPQQHHLSTNSDIMGNFSSIQYQHLNGDSYMNQTAIDERHHYFFDQNLQYANQQALGKSIKDITSPDMNTSNSSNSLSSLADSSLNSYQAEDQNYQRLKRKTSTNQAASTYSNQACSGSKLKLQKLNSQPTNTSSHSQINYTSNPPSITNTGYQIPSASYSSKSSTSSSPTSPMSPGASNLAQTTNLNGKHDLTNLNQAANEHNSHTRPYYSSSSYNQVDGGLATAPQSTPLQLASHSSPLLNDMNHKYVNEWLITNRFCHLLHLFNNYTSNDILRLTKEDMINLCGAPDGIRCYNMAHNIQIKPKLTIFITFQSQTYFSAIFLPDWKNKYLISKLFTLYSSFMTSIKHNEDTEINKQSEGNQDQNDEPEKLIEINNNIGREAENMNSRNENTTNANQKLDDEKLVDKKIQNDDENENDKNSKSSDEKYVINENHYLSFDLMKNSNFEYELFLKVKDILVKTTDEVLNNFVDQSRFMIEFELPKNVIQSPASPSSTSNKPINNKSTNDEATLNSLTLTNSSNGNQQANTTSYVTNNSLSKSAKKNCKTNNVVKIIMIPLD